MGEGIVKILSRYMVGEFMKYLLIFEGVFVFIYLIIDFLQKIDNFIEAGAAKPFVFLYFLYKTPFIMVHMVPPAIAISVIVMFSIMRKSSEITALKACGVNLFRISQVLVLAASGVGLMTFLTSEILVPFASSRSNTIWKRKVEKQDPGLFYGSNQVWYKGSEWIYWIRNFDSKNQIMENPIFFFFDNGFRLTRKIEGKRGIWEKGRWKLEQAAIQELDEKGDYRLKRMESLYLDIPEKPESFVKGLKKPEEMGYWQLRRYADQVREEGYDNSKYLVDMNIKIAFPFICLVLVVTSVPIALGLKKGGTPLGITVGIATCFLYLMTLGFSRSLGLMGAIPPVLSAWLANLIFSFAGIYLMMHIER
ncbi:MAG: YjgP/YjgQ family permease [Desulfobacteraceae bacterium]|nr:MAG: YjgP/YjgQ family permease [Desulfobacteraceae bacterium]